MKQSRVLVALSAKVMSYKVFKSPHANLYKFVTTSFRKAIIRIL